MAQGKTPKILVDPKVWDGIIKMVEIMPKLELFERIVNGESILDAKVSVKKEMDIAENEEAGGNAFEERSKIIKAKLNGETNNGTKTN